MAKEHGGDTRDGIGNKRFSFDSRISVGNVLTVLAISVSMSGAYYMTRADVNTATEKISAVQMRVDQLQEKKLDKETFYNHQDSQKERRDRLDKAISKLNEVVIKLDKQIAILQTQIQRSRSNHQD